MSKTILKKLEWFEFEPAGLLKGSGMFEFEPIGMSTEQWGHIRYVWSSVTDGERENYENWQLICIFFLWGKLIRTDQGANRPIDRRTHQRINRSGCSHRCFGRVRCLPFCAILPDHRRRRCCCCWCRPQAVARSGGRSGCSRSYAWLTNRKKFYKFNFKAK